MPINLKKPISLKKKFDVLSPDGVSIHVSNTYNSTKEAEEELDKWCKRYEAQGYYSSAVRGRIELEDLPSYCSIIEI